jgi:hypothetical protein
VKAIPSQVIIFCKLNRGDASSCIQWAIDALCEGEDSPSLRILAGLTPPFCASEVRNYVTKTLYELHVEVPEGLDTVLAYAHNLIEDIVKEPDCMQRNLWSLCNLCIEENYSMDIYDFYLLRFAFDDLQEAEVQWYWDRADRNNIREIVLARCLQWLTEYEIKTK